MNEYQNEIECIVNDIEVLLENCGELEDSVKTNHVLQLLVKAHEELEELTTTHPCDRYESFDEDYYEEDSE